MFLSKVLHGWGGLSHVEVGPEEVAVVEVGPGPSHLLRGLVLDLHVLVVGAGEVLPLPEHMSGMERKRVSCLAKVLYRVVIIAQDHGFVILK